MSRIPKINNVQCEERIHPEFVKNIENDGKIIFSFRAIEKNDYFNLDSTCQNWAQELFATMKTVSDISVSDIYAGKYTGKTSPLRIHQHQNANSPCELPKAVDLRDMWQIRISRSKGGIHGILYENIFFVIWFDPHHNLYPDDRYGGLKKIIPPKSCCKDMEEQIEELHNKLEEEKRNSQFWEEYAQSLENKQK